MAFAFKGDDGKIYLIRCPKCDLENYAPAVASGQCAWCGYKATEDDVKEVEAPIKE